MRSKSLRVSLSVGVFLSVLIAIALADDSKYIVKVPGGLAFSEFRGYESWQTISVSRNENVVGVILGNPVMIDAYRSGIPGNGKPVPDGAKMAKIHWMPKQNEFFPEATVPGKLLNVDFMVKDSKRFADSGGWDMPCSITTPPPIRSRPAPQPACRRRGTMPSAGSRATRQQKQEITFLRITGSGERLRSHTITGA